jgi:zinc/manganese transport system substrate-binding protein
VPRHLTPTCAAVVAGVLAVALAGCGGPSVGDPASDGTVSVVASSDVWGDVARTVGGPDVAVTSLIDDPSQDPHSFEASPRALLAVAHADVVVENGGGYDDFMGRVLDSTRTKARVVDAVEVSGRRAPSGGELNEHVWYDVRAVAAVADRLAADLGHADRAHAEDYSARAQQLGTELAGLRRQQTAASRRIGGRSIAVTEPVPLYLTEACGLRDATPAEFSRAVEGGDDVSPAVLEKTLDLLRSGRVAALVYNAQTSGPITQRARAAAVTAGVPVVPVTETLPAGEHYLGWMRDNLDRITAAVQR